VHFPLNSHLIYPALRLPLNSCCSIKHMEFSPFLHSFTTNTGLIPKASQSPFCFSSAVNNPQRLGASQMTMALYKCLLTYYVPTNINKKALRELILIVGQLMRLRRAGFFDSTIIQEGQHRLTGQRAPPISGGTYRRRRTLIDGYLESPFPTACLL